MYVRLAFAVAAHLEPEILVVDEVLAVGDAEFQKKCLGKMDEVSRRDGRTVLFVSHNMATIIMLCQKVILLANGSINVSGRPGDIIRNYISYSQVTTSFRRQPINTTKPMVVGVSWVRLEKAEPGAVDPGIDVEVIISSKNQTTASIDLRLKDEYSNPVGFGSLGAFQSNRPVSLESGVNTILVNLATERLAIGEYLVSIDITNPHVEFFSQVEDCIRVEIHPRRLLAPTLSRTTLGLWITVLPLQVK